MLKIITTTILLLVNSTTYASDWLKLAGDDSVHFFIDASSVTRQNKTSKAWFKFSYAEPQKTAVTQKEYNEVKTLYKMNCADKTFAVIQDVMYSNTTVIDSYIAQTSDIKYSDIIPDSFSESAYNYVCNTRKR